MDEDSIKKPFLRKKQGKTPKQEAEFVLEQIRYDGKYGELYINEIRRTYVFYRDRGDFEKTREIGIHHPDKEIRDESRAEYKELLLEFSQKENPQKRDYKKAIELAIKAGFKGTVIELCKMNGRCGIAHTLALFDNDFRKEDAPLHYRELRMEAIDWHKAEFERYKEERDLKRATNYAERIMCSIDTPDTRSKEGKHYYDEAIKLYEKRIIQANKRKKRNKDDSFLEFEFQEFKKRFKAYENLNS